MSKMDDMHISFNMLARMLKISSNSLKNLLKDDEAVELEINILNKIAIILELDIMELVQYEILYQKKKEYSKENKDEYNSIIEIYEELAKRNYIDDVSDPELIIDNYRNFMEVINYSKIDLDNENLANYSEKERLFIITWIKIGLKRIRNITLNQKYNIWKLKTGNIFRDLANLDIYTNAELDISEEIIEIFKKYGIILEFEKELKPNLIQAYTYLLNTGELFMQVAKLESREETLKILYNTLKSVIPLDKNNKKLYLLTKKDVTS